MPRCEARLVTPSARGITLGLASQRFALHSFSHRRTGVLMKTLQTLQANSATMQSAICNTFGSQDHAEAGFAKAGTAQFSHGQELSLAFHEVPGHMACQAVQGFAQPADSRPTCGAVAG